MKTLKALKKMTYQELKAELKSHTRYAHLIKCIIKRYLTRLYFKKEAL